MLCKFIIVTACRRATPGALRITQERYTLMTQVANPITANVNAT